MAGIKLCTATSLFQPIDENEETKRRTWSSNITLNSWPTVSRFYAYIKIEKRSTIHDFEYDYNV